MQNQNEKMLDEIAGEDNSSRPPITQEIKFNGSEGVLYTEEGDKDKQWDKSFKAIILSIRVAYVCYVEDKLNEKKFVLSTHEGKSQQTEFGLTKYENGQREAVMQGTPKVLKLRYPDLKMQHILYLLCSDGKIRKIIAKGKSLSNAFDYYKQFNKDERKRQFMTTIEVKSYVFDDEKTQEQKTYYALIFEKGEKLAEPAIKLVNNALMKLKEQFDMVDNVKITEPAEKEEPEPMQIDSINKDDIPVIEENQDDINVSELPF